jgi:hypothetical protein
MLFFSWARASTLQCLAARPERRSAAGPQPKLEFSL